MPAVFIKRWQDGQVDPESAIPIWIWIPLVTISIICVLFISIRRLSPRLPSLPSFLSPQQPIRLPTSTHDSHSPYPSDSEEEDDDDGELPAILPSKAKRVLGISPPSASTSRTKGKGRARDKPSKVGGPLSLFWGRRRGGRSVGGIKLTSESPRNSIDSRFEDQEDEGDVKVLVTRPSVRENDAVELPNTFVPPPSGRHSRNPSRSGSPASLSKAKGTTSGMVNKSPLGQGNEGERSEEVTSLQTEDDGRLLEEGEEGTWNTVGELK